MNKIPYFDIYVGDNVEKVWIHVPLGIGSDIWHININNFFCGSVIKKGNKWRQLHSNKHEFTSDDIDAIGERIEEFCAAGTD
ncbi:hypothetical protein J3L18_30920 [Mucilaginibacter gossypii]|uniref:hypothetical protein n=1 Tax=Mucilaginibacter gossypii TaxID=551996 RepID=UPI000DCB09A7|nr:MULTISPECIES: hypothetical protein [Mucilaginibacter]QTE37460.1 hypothetical protein J3L18_30920 [Mucilaginibacter gossypii]RAV47475.1 hypothetical protein DIU36_29445 [Mucilaginibacter rubeus]